MAKQTVDTSKKPTTLPHLPQSGGEDVHTAQWEGLDRYSGSYWARGSWARIVKVPSGCWVHPSSESFAIQCMLWRISKNLSFRLHMEILEELDIVEVRCTTCSVAQAAVLDDHLQFPIGHIDRIKKMLPQVDVARTKLVALLIPPSVSRIDGSFKDHRSTLVSFDMRVKGRVPGHPPPPVCFVTIGDWGAPLPAMLRVAKVLAQIVEKRLCKFVISTGDNFYPVGVRSLEDPHWLNTFEIPYSSPFLQNIRWWICAGNHDQWGLPAQLMYAQEHPRWYFPDKAYGETVQLFQDVVKEAPESIELLVLDSTGRHLQKQVSFGKDFFSSVPEAQNEVVPEANGADLTKDGGFARHWKFLVNHEPIFSTGQHGVSPRNAAVRRALMPLIASAGLHAYFNGDDHFLEIHHYNGTDYFISGAGGGATYYRSKVEMDTRIFGLRPNQGVVGGVMLHCIQGDAMKTSLIDAGGSVLYERRTHYNRSYKEKQVRTVLG
jgi:acid phosphatase